VQEIRLYLQYKIQNLQYITDTINIQSALNYSYFTRACAH